MGGDTFGCIDYIATRKDDYFWGKSRPSIHMPRWASRILLEVKSVRVERVQDITHADCLAEGIREVTKDDRLMKYCLYDHPMDRYMSLTPWHLMPENAIDAFRSLWNSINEKRGYGWNENPWVWVVEFEVVN
jgi:hypothetical protein